MGEIATKLKIVEYDRSLAAKVAEMWNNSIEGWGGEWGLIC